MLLPDFQEMVRLEEEKLNKALAEIDITLKTMETGQVDSSVTRNSAVSLVAQS
ncbi:MAG: hypothetical protein V1913_04345 [Fibrobacterota bacterium]